MHDGFNFIYMSLIPGSTLKSAWSDLGFSEKITITEQLRDIVSMLRSIPQQSQDAFIGMAPHEPHSTGINILLGSMSCGPILDLYFRGDDHATGPFHSIKAFNDSVQFLSVPFVPLAGRVDPYRHLIPDEGKVYFTHADLHRSNIMISGPPGFRRISGILDWEQCGWYPEYWEYCKLLMNEDYEHEWRTFNWVGMVMAPYESDFTCLAEYWNWRCPQP